MDKVNRFRFPPEWSKERTEALVEQIRVIGIDRAEELINNVDRLVPPKTTLIAYLLKRKNWTLKDLAKNVDIPEPKVGEAIDYLQSRGYRVRYCKKDKTYRIHTRPLVERKQTVYNTVVEEELVLGVCSDTHLCSKHAREDLLAKMYEEYKKQGVVEVLHAGNLLDGYLQRINGTEVICTTMEGQVQYAVDHYPNIEGITTHFITGECHEGWWGKDIGIDVGRYIEFSFRQAGRNDLVYMGFMAAERLYKIKGRKEPFRVMLIHPKGGQSPASDTQALQKISAYLDKLNGPSPDLLISGHYHKAAWTKVGNMICLHAGSFQQAGPFMFGYQLLSKLAAFIVRLRFNKDGKMLTCGVDHYDYDWAFDENYGKNRQPVWSHKGF